MWIQLLKISARHPLKAFFAALLALACLVTAPFLGLRHWAHDDGNEVDAAANPRLLISRIWLDRMPEKPRDEVDLWIFFGSGFGVYEHGSNYKASMEFFEFERQSDKVNIHFFQDQKRVSTRFEIKKCDDDPSFDLCLDLASSPRGPSRYYSWGRDGEDSAQIPWAAAWKRGAEERARAAAADE